MRVSLRYEEQVGAFDFDPASVTWQRQSGQFVVGHPTGQTKELARVFIKKWQGRTAPAHRLLVDAATGERRLPSTPATVGYAQDSNNGHYYFSENLPKEKYRLLEKMISGGGDDAPTRKRLENVLIERNLGQQVVRAAATLFATVNRRGFVYSDFSHKNIMVQLESSKCLLIDLDSCIPSDTLPIDRSGMGGLGSEFAVTYWRAWHSVVGVFTPEMLSRTMVLSFAAVWARAAALLRAGEKPSEVQRLLRGPSEADQMPMWKALESGDRNGFREYFALGYGSDSDPLFGSFREILTAMRNGEAVEWPKLMEACEGLFQAVRTAKVQAPTQVVIIDPPAVTPPIQPSTSAIVDAFWDRLFDIDRPIGRIGYAVKAAVPMAMIYVGYVMLNQKMTLKGLILTLIGMIILNVFNFQREKDYRGNNFAWPLLWLTNAMSLIVLYIIDKFDHFSGFAFKIHSWSAYFAIYSILLFPVLYLYNCIKPGRSAP